MKLDEIKKAIIRTTEETGPEFGLLSFMLAQVNVADVSKKFIESEFLDKSEVTSKEVKETFKHFKVAVSLMMGHSHTGNMANIVSQFMALAITEVNVSTPNDEVQEIIQKCEGVVRLLRRRVMLVAMIKQLDEEIMEKYISSDDPFKLDHEDDDVNSLVDLFKKIKDN